MTLLRFYGFVEAPNQLGWDGRKRWLGAPRHVVRMPLPDRGSLSGSENRKTAPKLSLWVLPIYSARRDLSPALVRRILCLERRAADVVHWPPWMQERSIFPIAHAASYYINIQRESQECEPIIQLPALPPAAVNWQRRSVNWLLWRETFNWQTCKGEILTVTPGSWKSCCFIERQLL